MLTQKQIVSALEASVAQAGTLLSSFQKKPAGNYTQSELLVASAYVQLAHAAFETALEQTTISIAQRCGRDFKKSKILRRETVSLIAYYLNKKKFPKTGDIPSGIVPLAVDAHISAVGHSHGIVTRNVNLMFLPLGLRVTDTHNVLASAWNSFGVFRGGVAHRGTVAFDVDPKDKQAEVEANLLPQTKAFIEGLKF